MDTIFMNSENSKTSKPHLLKLKITSKLDLRLGQKVIALSNYCQINHHLLYMEKYKKLIQ